MPVFSWGTVTVRPSSAPSLHIVVPKKTLRRAVDRNRVTRRVRAALKLCNLPRLHSRKIAVFPHREALGAPFAVLVADLARALE